MVAFGRRHFHGGGAPLDVEVAEAVPEVSVSGVEGGRLCLQWLHDEGELLFSHGDGAGVRCRTGGVAYFRRRCCVGEGGFHVFAEDGADPSSEGRPHGVPDLLEAPEVGGRSVRVAQKSPRRHRGVRA